MVSFIGKILCMLLLFFTISQCITAYRLTEEIDIQDPSNTDVDLALNDHNDIRSVLWPKICFPALKKRDGHQIAPDGRIIKVASRSARRCYPFDK